MVLKLWSLSAQVTSLTSIGAVRKTQKRWLLWKVKMIRKSSPNGKIHLEHLRIFVV
jgi:hypothetical protein